MILKPNDLPACPACGDREVFVAENHINGRRWHYYTCRGCGHDVTFAWRQVNPVVFDKRLLDDLGRHLTLVEATA